MSRTSRRYLALAAGIVLAGVVLSGLARLPRPAVRAAGPIAAPPAATAALTVTGAGVSPARVAAGSDVALTIRNERRTAVTLRLAGYDDRLGTITIGAGATWSGRFVADRPGEDFAWMLDGEPAGRFAVAGSHLQEGHR